MKKHPRQNDRDRVKRAIEKQFPTPIQVEFLLNYLHTLTGSPWKTVWHIVGWEIRKIWWSFLFLFPGKKKKLAKLIKEYGETK